MNKIVLQKKIAYRDCPIYIRRRGEEWEYLTVINNEIYSSSIVARLNAFSKLRGKDYSEKEVSDITQYMIAMAQTTIDHILGAEVVVDKGKKLVKSPFKKF